MRVEIVGVPLDLGAARRGTDMGPSAIRCARLMAAVRAAGHEAVDHGNLHVPVAESRPEPDAVARYLPEVANTCRQLAAEVAGIHGRGGLPLVLGGDHSVSVGSLAGRRLAGRDGGLLWLDAHADFNTPQTTPSGNIHGMPLAVATGRGAPELVSLSGDRPAVPEEAVALVGLRSVDPAEREALRASGMVALTMADVDREGMAAVMGRALDVATAGGRRPLHLSFDLDVLDPAAAPGVGTPVPGGLTWREAHLAMELVSASGLCAGADFVEVNPILDTANRTAELAVALIASLLGQRIL